MSKGALVAKKTLKIFGVGFSIRKKCIYKSDFNWCATGLFVERSAYKDIFFIRDLVLPFFRNVDYVDLSYSDRILNITKKTDFFEGPPDEIVRHLSEVIAERDLVARYSVPYTPERFLQRFARPDNRGFPATRLAAIGAAAALSGDLSLAADCLHHARHDVAANIAQDFRVEIQTVFLAEIDATLAALATGGEAMRSHLLYCCRRNAATLGFVSSSPAPPE